MLRRLVIVNDASTARGGATGLALLSARLMRERGVEVTLFCGDDGGNPALAAEGIEVVAAGGARLLDQSAAKSLASGLWNAAAARRLAAFIAATDAPGTIYHLHGWAQILSPAVFGPLRKVAHRTVVHAHDYFLACPNGVFTDYRRGEACERVPLSAGCLLTNCDKRSYAHKLWRAARTAGLRRAFDQRLAWGAVAVLHPGMRERLARAGIETGRMEVLRNPALAYTAERVAVEGNRRLFFIGRLEEDKGVRDVIAAAEATGMPLTVVGEGPLRAELAARHPGVIFTGWKGREEIGALVTEARGVAMASRHGEPFGLVAAEALMSGVPVVLPESSLLSTEVSERALGFVYDGRQRGGLLAAVERLRDLPEAETRAMSLRAAAAENALALTPEAWGEALAALYGRLLG